MVPLQHWQYLCDHGLISQLAVLADACCYQYGSGFGSGPTALLPACTVCQASFVLSNTDMRC